MQIHNIPPVYDKNSRILILGSFPSVKSREEEFFYAHPQNRFWKVCASVFECKVPLTVADKKKFLISNGIALWDVIASCEIDGSSDASITNAVPNDISEILAAADIRQIFCNGGKAHELYKKYIFPESGKSSIKLPSTSPANASWSLERLTEEWRAKILSVI